MKFLKSLKPADYIFALIILVFVLASILLAAPIMTGAQRDIFTGFLLVYNFTILLILVYRENRKNLK